MNNPSIVSQQNGLKIDVKGPKEMAFLKSAHEGSLFEGNSYNARVVGGGANFKNGTIDRSEDGTPPGDEVSRARVRMTERETARAAAGTSVDANAIDSAHKSKTKAPPVLSVEEQAAALNEKLFGKKAAPIANATVYRDGKPITAKRSASKRA